MLALLLFTPIVIATLLLFRNRVAFFGERYFIVVVPWLLLAVAVGVVKLSAISFQLSAFSIQRSAVGRRPSVVGHLPSAICHLLSAICYLPPSTFSL